MRIFILSLLFLAAWLKPVFALEHAQKDGLFKMDIPAEWHWMEYPQEIIITYPDGKTMAMDIQLVASVKMTDAATKKIIKESNAKMIKEGIQAHNGVLLDNKEMKLDGVYATRLDFQTSPPNVVTVAYISCFNKGYAMTITYGSEDEKIRSVMDDALATLKF